MTRFTTFVTELEPSSRKRFDFCRFKESKTTLEATMTHEWTGAMRATRFVVLLPLLGCAHRTTDPFREPHSVVSMSLPTDSLLLARLGREHPCAIRVPRLSRFSDSVSTKMSCTLVETAIAAIRDLNGAPEALSDLRQFRIERVGCVTVRQEAMRSEWTRKIDAARWTLAFTSDEQPDVGVSIDRRTGEASAYSVHSPEGDVSIIDPCD